MAQIVAAARQAAVGGRVILVFADVRYADVLMNWLVALASLRIDGYLIVALDRVLHEFLSRRQISTVLLEQGGDLQRLWIRRIDVFAALNAGGLDVLHSDADAVWLKDPRAEYFFDDADLTISQGTVWPPNVHQQLGFVMCCGLFQLKSNSRTQRLMRELAQHVRITGDDQISLNQLIVARHPSWRIRETDRYYSRGAGKQFLCSRTPMYGVGNDGLSITVLSHHLFQRVPDHAEPSPYVLHLLAPKEANAKMQEFDRAGCRLLRPDWRTVVFDASSISRLAAVS